MESDPLKKCFINGVEYECRTCFDPGSNVYSLTQAASGKIKTWRVLLNEIVQLQTSDDDLLPKTMCCKCLEKLKTAYDFIVQVHSVNKKYLQLLGNCNDPLQESVINDTGNFYSDCLQESSIDIPLEQYIPEIKLEDDIADQYNIVLLGKEHENDITKLENKGKVSKKQHQMCILR